MVLEYEDKDGEDFEYEPDKSDLRNYIKGLLAEDFGKSEDDEFIRKLYDYLFWEIDAKENIYKCYHDYILDHFRDEALQEHRENLN